MTLAEDLFAYLRDDAAAPHRWAERLNERAQREQWHVDRDVSWAELELDRFPVAARQAMLPIYTQIQFGELMTLGLVGRILDRVPELWAKKLAAMQIADELRHVDFFTRVVASLGAPNEVAQSMRIFFDELGGLEDPRELLLGSQVILEGFAKCVFEEASGSSAAAAKARLRLPDRPEPERLLAVVSERIGRDESRHVAFGVLYLQQSCAKLGSAERTRLQDLAERLTLLLEGGVHSMERELRRVGMSKVALLARIRNMQMKQFKRIGFDV